MRFVAQALLRLVRWTQSSSGGGIILAEDQEQSRVAGQLLG
jgi:hypothetical protein